MFVLPYFSTNYAYTYEAFLLDTTQGLQRLQEKGLQYRSATAHKKLSVHEGRNKAYCFPGPEKQTHC